MEGGTEERCRRREIKRTGGRGWREGGMEGRDGGSNGRRDGERSSHVVGKSNLHIYLLHFTLS